MCRGTWICRLQETGRFSLMNGNLSVRRGDREGRFSANPYYRAEDRVMQYASCTVGTAESSCMRSNLNGSNSSITISHHRALSDACSRACPVVSSGFCVTRPTLPLCIVSESRGHSAAVEPRGILIPPHTSLPIHDRGGCALSLTSRTCELCTV